MTTTAVHVAPAPTPPTTAPTWTVRVAHAIPLVALPVCVWRLPIAFGYGMGGETLDPAWFNIPYVFGLSVLSEIAALLSFGLVRGWGEVVPAWVPRIGGRRIPPAAVIVPAGLGGLLFTALGVAWLVTALTQGPGGWPYADGWNVLAMTVSGLMTLWGPLLLVLTVAYHRRRR
ncbi:MULTISPECIES: hypothetical protein [Streptomyces]|uniref:hypothetical protein n=1 Tax=Streptomyces TaxID=1883 RepID=UPI001E2BE6CA|nr:MULTISPECIES: hypothetical protein [Streptomyces]UFQ17041.1 hypothetical protein J2N69_19670 [Streptomyces huasconensis]WCL86641.1 hypothetical protein PPN52_19675 [Streptomyces sp. JCM 35825]